MSTNQAETASANTDRLLYEDESQDVGYRDKCSVTANGAIILCAGGYCSGKKISEWVELAWPKNKRGLSTNQAETASAQSTLEKVLWLKRPAMSPMGVIEKQRVWAESFPEIASLVESQAKRNAELEAENKLLRGALEQAARESCYCEWTDCSHDKAKEALKFSPYQK